MKRIGTILSLFALCSAGSAWAAEDDRDPSGDMPSRDRERGDIPGSDDGDRGGMTENRRQTITLAIPMTSERESPAAVTRALRGVKGVSDVQVNYRRGEAVITTTERIETQTLVDALDRAGFRGARLADPNMNRDRMQPGVQPGAPGTQPGSRPGTQPGTEPGSRPGTRPGGGSGTGAPGSGAPGSGGGTPPN